MGCVIIELEYDFELFLNPNMILNEGTDMNRLNNSDIKRWKLWKLISNLVLYC